MKIHDTALFQLSPAHFIQERKPQTTWKIQKIVFFVAKTDKTLSSAPESTKVTITMTSITRNRVTLVSGVEWSKPSNFVRKQPTYGRGPLLPVWWPSLKFFFSFSCKVNLVVIKARTYDKIIKWYYRTEMAGPLKRCTTVIVHQSKKGHKKIPHTCLIN